MIKVDLHTHSTCSDGLLTPEEVVERAYKKSVKYLALTDHDTVKGLDIAKKIREKDTSAIIIFLTNYDKYVYDAFEVKTFRYIPKDVIEEKL